MVGAVPVWTDGMVVERDDVREIPVDEGRGCEVHCGSASAGGEDGGMIREASGKTSRLMQDSGIVRTTGGCG